MAMNFRSALAGAFLLVCGLAAQAQGWQVPQPTPGLMPNPVQGKKLYGQYCAACHGADLLGVDKGEKKGPPLLHKIYEPAHHGDAAFQMAARNGVRAHHWPFGNMAPVPGLTDPELAGIIRFVREVQVANGIR